MSFLQSFLQKIRASTFLFVYLAVCILLVGIAFSRHQLILQRSWYAYENSQLWFDHSAQTASELGNKHFDATRPESYDLDRAEYLYRLALQRDASYPLVRHQLARIDFLRSRFIHALVMIDDEIALSGAQTAASTYYVRGLILGYMDRFDEAAASYRKYLDADPTNWAAINDYAWVLLKAERYTEALTAINGGLQYWPENPWLLNSKATALFELKQYKEAQTAALAAAKAVTEVTPEEWSHAYPGNDPLIAKNGLESFRRAIDANLQKITETLAQKK